MKFSEWLKNPLKNPISKRPIKLNGPTYTKFEKKCSNKMNKERINLAIQHILQNELSNSLTYAEFIEDTLEDFPTEIKYLENIQNSIEKSLQIIQSFENKSEEKTFTHKLELTRAIGNDLSLEEILAQAVDSIADPSSINGTIAEKIRLDKSIASQIKKDIEVKILRILENIIYQN